MKRGHAIGIAVHYDGQRIALGFDMEDEGGRRESYMVALGTLSCMSLVSQLSDRLLLHLSRNPRKYPQ